MKVLIVAGPYEAERIRRAAVSAGIEAVAVEPGESLSAWITATRPEVIVAAPQVINADPAVALAKIRAVPRGRVPILLVGEAGDEPALRPLADGFFVRPIAADDLIAQARAVTGAVPRAADDAGSGPQQEGSPASGDGFAGPRPLTPLEQAQPRAADGEPGSGPVFASPDSGSGRRALRPLVSDSGPLPVPVPVNDEESSRGRRVPPALDRLAETIDATIDAVLDADLAAELQDVVRAVDARAAEKSGRVENGHGGQVALAPDAPVAADPDAEALTELTDESSQKTREVPRVGQPTADEPPLDVPSLLARMYLSRLSGRLTLQAGVVRKHIVFDEGHPVLAASSRTEDRLREMLVRLGRLDPGQAAALGDEAASTGRRLGALLVERGLLPASELTALVRRHYEEIIHSVFTWERGAWTLGTDRSQAAQQEKVRLSQHPAALILTGVRRHYGALRALASLGGAAAVLHLGPSAAVGELLEKMELDEQERHAALLFDGWHNLSAVADEAGLSLDTVATLAWTLLLLERLQVAPLAAGAGDAAPITGRDEATDRALVQARHALVLDGDYFQVLGVSRDATADEIRHAHQALLASLHPAALHPGVAADLRVELEEIRSVLDEACVLLEDDRLRQQYRDHLPGASAAPQP